MWKKKKKKKEPEATVICPKCGEKYPFAKFEHLDNIDVSEPCRKCGFYHFLYQQFRLQANGILMEKDPAVMQFIRDEDYDSLNDYIEDKTGLVNMQAKK